jgi:hypothetical protein
MKENLDVKGARYPVQSTVNFFTLNLPEFAFFQLNSPHEMPGQLLREKQFEFNH